MKAIRRTLLAALVPLVCGPAAAESPRGPCLQDALERWFCAKDPKGVAVLDNLGEVVCAPGRCVELEDEWHCASVSGGGAELTPEGPVCEGDCRAPRAVDCERGMGPASAESLRRARPAAAPRTR